MGALRCTRCCLLGLPTVKNISLTHALSCRWQQRQRGVASGAAWCGVRARPRRLQVSCESPPPQRSAGLVHTSLLFSSE